MKKSRFTNEQIAFALKQGSSGTPVDEWDDHGRNARGRGIWAAKNGLN